MEHVLAANMLSPCYKKLVHAFSCAYIELWMDMGSLESTQEARVALGYISSSYCFASFVLPKLLDIRTLNMNEFFNIISITHELFQRVNTGNFM